MLPFRSMVIRSSTARARVAAGLFVVAAAAPSSAQSIPPVDDELAPPTVRLDLSLGSGARALGMGGAFLARPDDATAASWNPAGLSYLRRPEVSVAGLISSTHTQGVLPTGELESSDRGRSTSPDFIAATHPIDLGPLSGAAQLSFQRVFAFSGGRDILRGGRVIRLETHGGFDVLSAAAGVQVASALRVGASLNRWFNGYSARFVREDRNPEIRTQSLHMYGWNVNAGLIVTPWENFNLGVVGKTPFTGNVGLARSRTDPPLDEMSVKQQLYRDDLTLDFPGAAGLGASWRISSPLTVSMDVTRTFWSNAVIRNYFVLNAVLPDETFPLLPYPSTTSTKQRDTEQIRVGLEYVLFLGKLKCPLRAGYVSDRQYFGADDRNPETSDVVEDGPTPRFNTYTVGTGLSVGRFLVDVAYVMERGRYVERIVEDRDLTKKTTTHRVFVSLIFRFGGRY